jgi:hypothetical protein
MQLLRQRLLVHAAILPKSTSLTHCPLLTAHYSLLTFVSLLNTTTPLPRHWGTSRKGRAVFRREDRYKLREQLFRCGTARRESPHRAPGTASRPALLHCVVGGHRE